MPDGPDHDAFQLPEEGDYLFEEKFSISHALIWREELARFYDMKEGYKLAGEALVRYWLTQDRTISNERVVFPALFCYRHFLELSMKWLLWHHPVYRSKEIFKAHNLKRLWEKCRLVLKGCGADEDQCADQAQRMILEMHEMDPESFNFRYAFNPNGMPIDLAKGSVNLIRLHNGIEKLDNFFGISVNIVDVELDRRSEFL